MWGFLFPSPLNDESRGLPHAGSCCSTEGANPVEKFAVLVQGWEHGCWSYQVIRLSCFASLGGVSSLPPPPEIMWLASLL